MKSDSELSEVFGKLHDAYEKADGNGGWDTGVIKWFDAGKGYGFIVPDDGGEDVFIHASSVSGIKFADEALKDGQLVEFKVQSTERGLRATAVRLCLIPPSGDLRDLFN